MTRAKSRGVRSEGDRVAAMCQGIRLAIIEGALMPGDRLPEDALGETFGASRTIARHALGQLSSEGLVDLRRNRIAVVATPSPEDARDIFDIRKALERQVVGHVTGNLTTAQIDELKQLVAAEHEAGQRGEKAAIRYATEFHVRLAQYSGRPTLIRYVTEICFRGALALSTLARPHSSECAISEHLALIEAIRRGPAEKAMAMMEEHLEAVAARANLQGPGQVGRDLATILAPYARS